MRRTLSSKNTVLRKYLFPIIWIGGFGLGTLALWTVAFDTHGDPDIAWMRWLFLSMWLVGSSSIAWFSSRLRRVEVDEGFLYVSNYFSEVKVPLTEIRDVTESWFTNPKTVTIHFRNGTPAGKRTVFIPYSKFVWGSHPVVAELKELRDKASASGAL